MKTRQFSTIAIVIGVLITGIIISSFTPSQENENIPRYHMFYPAASGVDIFVYDAVTGNYKTVKYNELKDGKNIKELLEK